MTKRSATTDSATAPVPIQREDFARLERLLLEQEWIFAKTMPHNPHEYSLRKRWTSDADFIWTVETIRRHGYRHKYGNNNSYIQLDVKGYFYWTMGWPIGSLDRPGSSTILINRKPLAAAGIASDAGGVQEDKRDS